MVFAEHRRASRRTAAGKRTAPYHRRGPSRSCASHMGMDNQCFLSSDVDLNIKLLVLNFHGSIADSNVRVATYAESLMERTGCAASDLFLRCQLYTHGQPLGLPERTCNTPGSRLRWNEWITFRAKYTDLSPDAWVELSLVGSAAPRFSATIAKAQLPLFSESRQLRSGVIKVPIELAAPQRCEETICYSASAAASNTPETDEKELARLEQLAARHEAATSQPDPALDWLNRLTYAHLEQRQQVPSGEPPSLLGTPGVLWAAQFRPSS